MALTLDIDPITGLPRRRSPFFLSPDEQQGQGQQAPFPAPNAQLAPFPAPAPPVEPPPPPPGSPPDVVDPQMRRALQLPQNQPDMSQYLGPEPQDYEYDAEGNYQPHAGVTDLNRMDAPFAVPTPTPRPEFMPTRPAQPRSDFELPGLPPVPRRVPDLTMPQKNDYSPTDNAGMPIFPTLDNGPVETRGQGKGTGKLAGLGAPPPDTSPDALRQIARTVAMQTGLDPDIFERLVNQESGFNPKAGSPAGAQGLTQLMPATARGLGVTDPFDPIQNLKGGARYLKQQLDRYNGDYRLALAAFNAGPGAVDKYGGVPPFEETQRYVKNILGTEAGNEGTKFRVMSAGRLPAEPSGDTTPPDTTPLPSPRVPRLPEGLPPEPPAPPPVDVAGGLLSGLQAGLGAANTALEPIRQGMQAVGETVGSIPLPGGGVPGLLGGQRSATLGELSTNLTKTLDPLKGLVGLLEDVGFAAQRGDVTEIRKRSQQLVEGLGRSGMTPLEFFTKLGEEQPLSPATLAISILGDPQNILMAGADPLLRPLFSAAGQAARAAGRGALEAGGRVGERLTGIDPATGRRYAEQGGLDLGAGERARSEPEPIITRQGQNIPGGVRPFTEEDIGIGPRPAVPDTGVRPPQASSATPGEELFGFPGERTLTSEAQRPAPVPAPEMPSTMPPLAAEEAGQVGSTAARQLAVKPGEWVVEPAYNEGRPMRVAYVAPDGSLFARTDRGIDVQIPPSDTQLRRTVEPVIPVSPSPEVPLPSPAPRATMPLEAGDRVQTPRGPAEVQKVENGLVTVKDAVGREMGFQQQDVQWSGTTVQHHTLNGGRPMEVVDNSNPVSITVRNDNGVEVMLPRQQGGWQRLSGTGILPDDTPEIAALKAKGAETPAVHGVTPSVRMEGHKPTPEVLRAEAEFRAKEQAIYNDATLSEIDQYRKVGALRAEYYGRIRYIEPADGSKVPPPAPGYARLYRTDTPEAIANWRNTQPGSFDRHVADDDYNRIRSWRDANAPDGSIYYIDLPITVDPWGEPEIPMVINPEQRSRLKLFEKDLNHSSSGRWSPPAGPGSAGGQPPAPPQPPQPPHTSGPGNAGGGRWQPPSGDEPGQAMPPTTPEDNVVGLRPINSGLTAWDRLLNNIKGLLGEQRLGAKADVDATPAFRERARVQPNIDSQAVTFAAEGAAKVRKAFKMDAQGRITELADDVLGFPKGPTLQDLAARRPAFEERWQLTPAQTEALDWLRDQSAPYKKLWDELGLKDPGSRPDVMEGGFYLPRGRADKEGAEEAMKVFAGPTRRGKAGFEKSAVFDSMAQGIDEGYQYHPIHDVLYSYVKEAGSRIADQHVANYFSGLTDELGNLLYSTAADRVDPAFRTLVQTLRAKIYARRVTLTRQNVRERMAGMTATQAERFAARQNDLLEKAQERFEARLAGKNTDDHLKVATAELRLLERQARRADRLAAAAERRAQGAEAKVARGDVALERADLSGKGSEGEYRQLARETNLADREHQVLITEATRDEGLAADAAVRRDAAKQKYDDLVAKNAPDTQTKVAQREYTIMEREAGKAQTRAELSRAKADAFTVKRGATETTLRQLQDDLDSLSGRWKLALEQAAQTPRDMATIDLRGLEGKAFPLALANAANSWLAAEKPLTGARGLLYRGLEGFNHLLRSVGSTGDNSVIMIQGLLGGAKDPAAFKTAMRINLQAWLNGGEHVLGAFLTTFDKNAIRDGVVTASDWARSGLHIGGQATEYTIPRGGGGTLGQIIGKTPVLGGAGRLLGDAAARANRAFGYFGDTLRLEMAQHELKILMQRTGQSLEELRASGELEGIAKGINDITGWDPTRFGGSLGDLATFAPRYLQSRLTTAGRAIAGTAQGAAHVATFGAVKGASREQVIARTAVAYLVADGVAITWLANTARGYDTDFNPVRKNEKGEWSRNPNFLRIRNVAGNDISVFGPWDSLVGMIAQAGAGVANRNVWQAASAPRAIAAPLISKTWDFISGSDLVGNPVRDTAGHLAGWIASSFLPFQVQNAPQLAKEVGTAVKDQSLPELGGALAVGAYQFAGGKASPQSYGDFREQISQNRYKLPYSQLNQDQRRVVRAELDALAKQEAFKPLPPPDTGTPQQQAAWAFQRKAEVETDLEKGLRANIDAGMTGKDLNKKIQDFTQNRWRASQDLLDTPAVKEALRRDKKPLWDMLGEKYWNVPLDEDPRTGDLNFSKQKADRLNVLEEARAAGVPLNYVKGKGEGTFRGARFTDPVVRRMVEQRENDMETLTPYFEVPDELRRAHPEYDSFLKRIEALPPNDPKRQLLEDSDKFEMYTLIVKSRRESLRRRNRELEKAGERWLEWKPLGVPAPSGGVPATAGAR